MDQPAPAMAESWPTDQSSVRSGWTLAAFGWLKTATTAQINTNSDEWMLNLCWGHEKSEKVNNIIIIIIWLYLQLKVEWQTIQSLKKYSVKYIINKIY